MRHALPAANLDVPFDLATPRHDAGWPLLPA
jgi:hypothetical protein